MARRALLRASAGGATVVAGAAAIASAGGRSKSIAAPSRNTDADILNFFLLLEYVQEGFYEQALAAKRLEPELEEFARTVGSQESEHVAFLTRRLGTSAREKPALEFGDSASSAERFRERAIELEEATIGAYIGQSANLTADAIGAVATLVSVEARQVAWARDLAGLSPAPRAADPGRKSADVLGVFRDRGYIQ